MSKFVSLVGLFIGLYFQIWPLAFLSVITLGLILLEIYKDMKD